MASFPPDLQMPYFCVRFRASFQSWNQIVATLVIVHLGSSVVACGRGHLPLVVGTVERGGACAAEQTV